jgi:HSP20 family protein
MASHQTEKHVAVRSSKKEEPGTQLAPWRPQGYAPDLDRAFEDLARQFDIPFAPFAGRWLAQSRRFFRGLPDVRYPYADLIDSGDEYRVLAEVPGITKDKLDVTVSENEVRIEGEAKTEVKEEKEGYVRRERGYSRVSRTLAFPDPVVVAKAVANLRDGVLEVRVPKKTPTKVTRRKVAVK